LGLVACGFESGVNKARRRQGMENEPECCCRNGTEGIIYINIYKNTLGKKLSLRGLRKRREASEVVAKRSS